SLAAAGANGSETLSPELALVDPLLGHRVRARLPELTDTLARIELDLTRRRLTALAESAIATAEAPRQQHVPKGWSPRSPRPSRLLTAGGLVAAGLVAALLVGVNVDVHGIPAGADSTSSAPLPAHVLKQPLTTRPPRIRARSRADQSHALEPRRFAWAP